MIKNLAILGTITLVGFLIGNAIHAQMQPRIPPYLPSEQGQPA